MRLLEKLQGEYGEIFYHSHLGEIDQTLLGEVWGPLLDEGQVSEVHAQVGNARRVTAIRAEGKMLDQFQRQSLNTDKPLLPLVWQLFTFSASLSGS